MKKLFNFLIKLIVFLIIVLGLILGYFTLFDYTPYEKIVIFENKEKVTKIRSKKISLLIWNIGYAGLGEDMDFFYDGGKKTRSSKEQTIENLNQINKTLEEYDFVDFMLLQEIDVESKRSYYINELDTINKTLADFSSFYAPNYRMQFVPVPITDPLGSVEAGLATYSKHSPKSVIRYSFPGNFAWPTKLFTLDRCFLCNRYPVKKDKELVVINTHNSAFDKDGRLKTLQMEYLKKFIIDEYKKGNFVIIGGDWNQTPPKINNNTFINDDRNTKVKQKIIVENFMPQDWKWVYDSKYPTNRSLITAYNSESTSGSVIDFYLISPNIEIINCETINLNFVNSDHQPIFAELKLKY